MPQVDTLIHPHWIVTVNATDDVLEHHSLAIVNGEIFDILPTAAATKYTATAEYTLEDHALMPGLINAHTHAPMSLMRGLADDLALMDWLENHIWPAEAAQVSPEFVALGSELAIAELVRGGITCFNDMYFFPEEVAKVADASGIRAVLGIILLDFPSAYGSGPDEYLNKGLALNAKLATHPRLSCVLAPHAPYTVSDEPLTKLKALSDDPGLRVHMHIHETAGEVAMAVEQSGMRPLARLDKLGLVNDKLLAVHMTQLTDAEIALLAERGASVLHCPESNMKLASGFCPVDKLLKAGINVALGTDGAASNNDLDMFGEMRTAALVAKNVAGDATALPAAQAIRMATINGAAALGMDSITGSVEIGKQADVIAVDLGALETQPVYNPVSQLVYATNRNQVRDVWVAGEQLLNSGVLTRINTAALGQRVRQWHSALPTE